MCVFKEPCRFQYALNESQPLPIQGFNPLRWKTNVYSPILPQRAGRLFLQSPLQLRELTGCRCVHTRWLVEAYCVSIWHACLCVSVNRRKGMKVSGCVDVHYRMKLRKYASATNNHHSTKTITKSQQMYSYIRNN